MTNTQKVFDLLLRITDCCDRIGVPYYLGFYPLRLALTTKVLPDGVTSSEILVPLDELPRLKIALKEESGLWIEDLEENPQYTDCCLQVSDAHSTFVDIMHLNLSRTLGYSVYVTAIVSGSHDPEQSKFYAKRYETAQHNTIRAKPLHGFPFSKVRLRKRFQVQISPGHVRLLRKQYGKYSFPAAHFQGHTQVRLNGRSFSAVLEPEAFLNYYYKKDLRAYPAVSKLNPNRVIQQPELSAVPWTYGKAISIKICDKFLGLLNKPIKKYLSIVDRQKRFYFRTLDRFYLADLYASCRETYQAAYAKQDWEALLDIFTPYLETVQKYQRYNMPFAFDYECYEMLIELLYRTSPPVELLYNTSPSAQLCKWLVTMKGKSFAYLNYVSSYCDT